MRPRIDLVLLCRSDAELSRWRFLIELRGPFRVHGTTCVGEARKLLRDLHWCELAATNVPGELGADALADGADKVLLFGVPVAPTETRAERVLVGAPGSPAEVMEAVRVLAARKRGPKTKADAALSLSRRQLLRQLSIERDGVPA